MLSLLISNLLADCSTEYLSSLRGSYSLTQQWLTFCRQRIKILFFSRFKMTNKHIRKWVFEEVGKDWRGSRADLWVTGILGGDFQLVSWVPGKLVAGWSQEDAFIDFDLLEMTMGLAKLVGTWGKRRVMEKGRNNYSL